MPLPLHDSRLKRAGEPRMGLAHQNATQAELGGAAASLSNKAELRSLIYGLIVQSGSEGLTNAEIRDAIGLDPNSVSGRLTELETKDKLIMKTGNRRKKGSAKVPQNIWVRVPPEGRLL